MRGAIVDRRPAFFFSYLIVRMLEIENFPLLLVTQAFDGLGQRELALFVDAEGRVVVVHVHVIIVCHLSGDALRALSSEV